MKYTDSVKKNNTTAGAEANTTNKLENNEADIREADSTSEEKDHSSNQRTQEQAGEGCILPGVDVKVPYIQGYVIYQTLKIGISKH